MPYDMTSCLWSANRAGEYFFRDKVILPFRQKGPHCVSTVLAMLTGVKPEQFHGRVNTQDPVSWSAALLPWGMKLAYCPTDIRKLKHYMNELIELDDLFTLCIYMSQAPNEILGDPDGDGWITSSHIVLMHRDIILDPMYGTASKAAASDCLDYHTKRIFRVVPIGHERGI